MQASRDLTLTSDLKANEVGSGAEKCMTVDHAAYGDSKAYMTDCDVDLTSQQWTHGTPDGGGLLGLLDPSQVCSHRDRAGSASSSSSSSSSSAYSPSLPSAPPPFPPLADGPHLYGGATLDTAAHGRAAR